MEVNKGSVILSSCEGKPPVDEKIEEETEKIVEGQKKADDATAASNLVAHTEAAKIIHKDVEGPIDTKKGVKRKLLTDKLRKTPVRVKGGLTGKIRWVRSKGIGLMSVKDSPQQKRLKKEGGESPREKRLKRDGAGKEGGSVKRPKESPLGDTPNKRAKKDTIEMTEDVAGPSKTLEEGGKTGEGLSGEAVDNFTKPKQVRKKKLRRNSVRQNKNGKTKFFKRQPHGSGKNFKRRKKELRVIVPPTKFLLGGNINDPLNLNSLQDDALNAMTPKSSPLPTPQREIEVLVPRDMKDPLHLKSAADDAEYLKLLSKKNRKRRKRKRGYSGSGSGKEDAPEAITPKEEPTSVVEGAYVPPDTIPAKRESLSLLVKEAVVGKPNNIKLDKIVSPVVPQPGAWKRGQLKPPGANPKNRRPTTTPKFLPRNQRYQYGNYDRYYGYRNLNHEPDMRLQYFLQHPELFVEKDVLDIGCNIGHVTLCVARDLGAKSVVGLDIDKRLIDIARKNVKHYVQVTETPVYSNCASSRMPTPRTPHYLTMDSPAPQRTPHYCRLDSPAAQHTPRYSPAPYQTPHHTPHYSPATQINSPFHTGESPPPRHMEGPSTSFGVGNSAKPFFPISMPILYGPLELPGLSTHDDPLSPKPFPHNVNFIQGNYVLDSDALLTTEIPQFDTILCLSVTKWIHLNCGDAGLKRAFRRMFAQLRPGGKLVLEAQAWPSYNRKKALTEQIYRNYMSIEFMPDKFIAYLLSPQVGFTSVEEIGAPQHKSKGFRRPINVLTKPGLTPSSCNTPVCYTPYSQRTCVRRPVYTSLGCETFEVEEEKKSKEL